VARVRVSAARQRRSGLFLRRIALAPPDGAALPSGYPFDMPAVRGLGERGLRSPVTVFVGENAMGKSTLLEAVAVVLGLNPEGGSRGLRFETAATHSPLHACLRLTRSPRRPRDAFFLRAETFYNVATELDRLDAHPDNVLSDSAPLLDAYGGGSLHAQSHGESFFTLLLRRLGGQGLYLLDEPEAALSPQRQLALLVRMHELVQQGSQFLLATHAPMLMAYPEADVWHFTEAGIANVDPRATPHWQITKRFLLDPDGMLRSLLG
jgi:predicted ATPase